MLAMFDILPPIAAILQINNAVKFHVLKAHSDVNI